MKQLCAVVVTLPLLVNAPILNQRPLHAPILRSPCSKI